MYQLIIVRQSCEITSTLWGAHDFKHCGRKSDIAACQSVS